MNSFLPKFIISILTLIFCLQPSSAQDKIQSINLVGEVFPPATNIDGTGQQFEMVKAIFEPLGYSVNITVFPYKRALKLVETGEFDFMVGMLKENESSLLYSKYPHDADNLIVIFPKENSFKWQGISTLKNKRISVISGLNGPISNYLPKFGYEITEVNTRKQAMKKLFFNRTDFFIDCECGFLLDEVSSYRDNAITQRIGFLKIHLAFSNTVKGNQLKNIWDEQFPEFIHTEKARSIYEKWGMLREYDIIQEVLLTVEP